jgi:hypothetical protein
MNAKFRKVLFRYSEVNKGKHKQTHKQTHKQEVDLVSIILLFWK